MSHSLREASTRNKSYQGGYAEILVRHYIENEGTRQTLMDLVNETYLSVLKEKEEKGRVI